MVLAMDGEPVAAVVTNGSVHPPTDVALSTALIYAGIPQHAEGHDVLLQSLRIFALLKWGHARQSFFTRKRPHPDAQWEL